MNYLSWRKASQIKSNQWLNNESKGKVNVGVIIVLGKFGGTARSHGAL